MRRLALVTAAALALVAALGCGRSSGDRDDERTPVIGIGGDRPSAATDLGFPGFATKNTTRVGGTDADAIAAAVARARYPATSATTRPRVVALLDSRDWRAALAGVALAGPPLDAALLLSDGAELPEASATTLEQLAPHGADELAGAAIVRVGDVAKPEGHFTTAVVGADPFALARGVAGLLAQARGGAPSRVVVVSADDPALAMPAAAWAAKSGDPILFAHADELPAETVAALQALGKPRIFVLGPPSAIGEGVIERLGEFGTVRRIGDEDPVANAIAFARYRDGAFGWGIVEPGHGLVFARTSQPLDAVAAASLSSSGSYGPLLLLDAPDALSTALTSYLLDIQPGYTSDPVRGVYNHGWIVGDDRAIAVAVQARIDELLEIAKVELQGE